MRAEGYQPVKWTMQTHVQSRSGRTLSGTIPLVRIGDTPRGSGVGPGESIAVPLREAPPGFSDPIPESMRVVEP